MQVARLTSIIMALIQSGNRKVLYCLLILVVLGIGYALTSPEASKFIESTMPFFASSLELNKSLSIQITRGQMAQ